MPLLPVIAFGKNPKASLVSLGAKPWKRRRVFFQPLEKSNRFDGLDHLRNKGGGIGAAFRRVRIVVEFVDDG